MNKNKIPVSIITGFLGAGKTTLINNIIKKYGETQFALVENEFGDVAIDTKLIKGVDASQMFELRQGCICCTISDEYELVLQELAERFPNVEHLLIETTGIADPAAVIQPFFSDENLKEIYKFNGTICLVDAMNFENHPETDIHLKQIAIADLILITKSENLIEEIKVDHRKHLETLNPLAKIQFTEYIKPVNFDLDTILNRKSTEYYFVKYKSQHHQIQSKTLTFNSSINKLEFINWLSYTLDIHKSRIYRCKGIVCFENEPYEFILQGVGGSFELEEGDLILDSTKSELVFIGNLQNVDFTI